MKYVSLILALGVVGYFVGRYFYHQPEFVIGAKAPNFEAELIDERAFELYEFMEDKVVLIEFWGSWCPPCRTENKNMVKVYNEYKGKSYDDFTDFDIVGIALETNEASWKTAIQKDQLPWENQIYQGERMRSRLGLLYGITEIPSNYMINSKGTIIGVNMTAEDLEKYLIDHLKKG